MSTKDKARVGDIIFCSPEDATSYYAQILEINKDDNTCTLIKDVEGTISERIFKLPCDSLYLNLPKREYKVINLTEYPDHSTGKKILLAELSPIEKTFIFSAETDTIFPFFDFSIDTDLELYVLPLSSEIAQFMLMYPEETLMICHKMNFIERDFIKNGEKLRASYIFQPDYLSPKKQGLLKNSKYLFVL